MGLAVARISLNHFSPRRRCATLGKVWMDILATISMLYHTVEKSVHCSMQALCQRATTYITAHQSTSHTSVLATLSYLQASYACISGTLFPSPYGLSVFGPMSCPRTSYLPCMHRILPVAHDRCSHLAADAAIPKGIINIGAQHSGVHGRPPGCPAVRIRHRMSRPLFACESLTTPRCVVLHT